MAPAAWQHALIFTAGPPRLVLERAGSEVALCVAGHLQVHCQTQELKNWIDRPTYGAPTLVAAPTPVLAKCSVLEDVPEDDSQKRKCMRSEKCSKPDGHPGFCVGRQEGQRARNTQVRSLCIPAR